MTTPTHKPSILPVVALGAAMGLHLGLLHLFLWRSTTAPVAFLLGSVIFGAVTYGLWLYVFPRFTGSTMVRRVTQEALVALVVFGLLSIGLTEFGSYFTGQPGLFGTPTGEIETLEITPELRQRFAWIYAFLPVIPTTITALVAYHAVWLHVQGLRSRERELKDMAASAQLAALRAQINPHFLFNSLNSIAQLVHVDPDKAEACVERLAEIFRYVLTRAEQEFVTLADELDMIDAYLEIERARFDDRLRIETKIDPATLRRAVPNLILQPLVENAVKHGLSRKIGPGTLRIDARLDGDTLMITVGDDGLGIAAHELDAVWERGVGLRTLRARLDRLYGTTGSSAIVSAPGTGTRVELRLPGTPAHAA